MNTFQYVTGFKAIQLYFLYSHVRGHTCGQSRVRMYRGGVRCPGQYLQPQLALSLVSPYSRSPQRPCSRSWLRSFVGFPRLSDALSRAPTFLQRHLETCLTWHLSVPFPGPGEGMGPSFVGMLCPRAWTCTASY